ncbi:hypothetical protein [Dactylosporangium cerinum]
MDAQDVHREQQLIAGDGGDHDGEPAPRAAAGFRVPRPGPQGERDAGEDGPDDQPVDGGPDVDHAGTIPAAFLNVRSIPNTGDFADTAWAATCTH